MYVCEISSMKTNKSLVVLTCGTLYNYNIVILLQIIMTLVNNLLQLIFYCVE